jgi:hypothetical protein
MGDIEEALLRMHSIQLTIERAAALERAETRYRMERVEYFILRRTECEPLPELVTATNWFEFWKSKAPQRNERYERYYRYLFIRFARKSDDRDAEYNELKKTYERITPVHCADVYRALWYGKKKSDAVAEDERWVKGNPNEQWIKIADAEIHNRKTNDAKILFESDIKRAPAYWDDQRCRGLFDKLASTHGVEIQ